MVSILLSCWIGLSVILWSLAFYGIETNRTIASGVLTFLLCLLWPVVIVGGLIAVICEHKRIRIRPMR